MINILSFPCRNGCGKILTPGHPVAEIQEWHDEWCEEMQEGEPIMGELTGYQFHLFNKYRDR